VLRSSNGLDWEWTNRPGWDGPGNAFADYLDKGAGMFHGDLYVGTGHDAGGEVWRLRLAPRICLPVVMK